MSIIPFKEDDLNHAVTNRERYEFELPEDDLMLIAITARCKSWLQNIRRSRFDDDDLAIEIDGVPFYEFEGKRKEFNTPASWNGNVLKNSRKTVYVLIPFKQGSHAITFVTDGSPVVETIALYKAGIAEGKIIFTNEMIPAPENGKLYFDVATKGIEIAGIRAEGKSEGRSKPSLLLDGKRIKNWADISAKKEDRFHALEFRATNGAGVKQVEISFNRKLGLNPVGKVMVYKDFNMGEYDAKLRSATNKKSSSIVLAEIKNGELVEILEERIEGDYVPDFSKIWHKVRYQDKEGYILSTLVEIEGQERGRIVELIREKAVAAGVDPDLAIALAGCESKYKVYATSDKDARGVFQLTDDLITDMNDRSKPFYAPISNAFNFEENITASILYLKHLYYTVYKNSAHRLERTITTWNYTKVSPDGPFSFEVFPTDQPKVLHACTVENRKRRNWMHITHIIKPAITSLFLIASLYTGITFLRGQEVQYDVANNQIAAMASSMPDEPVRYADSFDETRYASDFERSRERPVKFGFDTRDKSVLLFHNDNTLAARISVERLGMEESFDLDDREKPPVLEQAIEPSPGIFYFLLTIHGACGSGGCVLYMYRYDAKRDALLLIKDDLFASTTGFFLSPDRNKMVFAHNAGSSCCRGGYVYLMDIHGIGMREIAMLDGSIMSNSVQNVMWKDDYSLEIEMYQDMYGDTHRVPILIKVFSYDIETGIKKLIKSWRMQAG